MQNFFGISGSAIVIKRAILYMFITSISLVIFVLFNFFYPVSSNSKFSCFQSFKELTSVLHGVPRTRFRIFHETAWADIVTNMLKQKKIRISDFEKIDFSLSGDETYGDNPEFEFFNPKGPFKAKVIPQEIIDRITSVRGTRPIFNLRRWYDTGNHGYEDYPSSIKDSLVIIIPNLMKQCQAEPDLEGWNFLKMKTQEVKILPDNRTLIVDDNGSLEGWRRDGERYYYINSFATRVNFQR